MSAKGQSGPERAINTESVSASSRDMPTDKGYVAAVPISALATLGIRIAGRKALKVTPCIEPDQTASPESADNIVCWRKRTRLGLMRIEKDLMVPTRDGSELCLNVFRPEDSQPAPVILCMSPYGKDTPVMYKPRVYG